MNKDNDKTVVVGKPVSSSQETLVSHNTPSADDATAAKPRRKNQVPPDNKAQAPQMAEPVRKRDIGIGTVINNRFVIEKLLGRGGMGVVYRALDKRKQEAKDRNPHVAIKILGDEFRRHPVAFVALQREARKSQELAHPNVITVYDFDRDGDIVYMTMEELNGKPLDKYIRENPAGVSAKEADKIIKEIAAGLAYAHSKKIVHSDLKPGNVFLTNDGHVKVLDFGIARAVSNISEQGESDKTLFDAGQLGGLTPSYASTEMFSVTAPHPSDDIYALGLMCYELYTGEHPFQRDRATEVLTSGRKPQRIRKISNHKWRTISASLELKRENRIKNAAEFLKKYEGISNTVLGLASSLVVVVLVLGSLVLFRTPDTGPEIPFEKLAQEIQIKVTDSLQYGSEALGFGDINGALIHFNTAYELHPRNEDAVKGLAAVVKKVVSAKIDKNNLAQLEEQKYKLDIMLKYSSLSDNEDLLQARDKIIDRLSRQ